MGAGVRNRDEVWGGRAWPTDTAMRGGGSAGVEEDLRELLLLCEWLCECDERGVGLVAVLLDMVWCSSLLDVRHLW